MIRLLLAEDHAIVRAGLRQLLTLVDDIEVAREGCRGAHVLVLPRRDLAGLVLLGRGMPGSSAADLITRLRAHYPRGPLRVLSTHNEPQIARRARAAGASG